MLKHLAYSVSKRPVQVFGVLDSLSSVRPTVRLSALFAFVKSFRILRNLIFESSFQLCVLGMLFSNLFSFPWINSEPELHYLGPVAIRKPAAVCTLIAYNN